MKRHELFQIDTVTTDLDSSVPLLSSKLSREDNARNFKRDEVVRCKKRYCDKCDYGDE